MQCLVFSLTLRREDTEHVGKYLDGAPHKQGGPEGASQRGSEEHLALSLRISQVLLKLGPYRFRRVFRLQLPQVVGLERSPV